MKRLKYILPILLVVAIVAVVIVERRDTLARRLANSMLSDSGVTVVDVSLKTVSGRRVAFNSLEIELQGGTRFIVEDLEAPLAFPSLAPEYLSIGRLQVEPSTGPAEPLRLTPLAQTILGLPERYPRTAITVSRLEHPAIPRVESIVWSTGEDFQRFNLVFQGMSVLLELDRADAVSHRANLTVEHPDIDAPLQADMAVIDRNGNVQVNAYTSIGLADWLPVARQMIAVPGALDSAEGTVFAMGQINLDSEIGGRVAAVINMATDGEVALQTSIGNDLRINARVPLNRPTEFRFDWPLTEWSLRSSESSWSTDGTVYDSLPVKVNELDCSSEGRCSLEVSVGPGTFAAASLRVDRVMMDLPLTVTLGETTTIEMSRDPSVFLTGVHGERVDFGAVSTLGVGNGIARLDASGFSATLDRVTVDLSTIVSDDNRVDALALRLEDLRYAEGRFDAGFRTPQNAGTWRFGDYSTRLPGTRGRIEWQDDRVAAGATFVSDADRVTGGFEINYDIEAASGLFATTDARIEFTERSLREQVTGIGLNADLIAGSATVAGRVPIGLSTEDDTPFRVTLRDVAARYEDVVATGIQGELQVMNTTDGPLLERGDLDVALLDIGLPLTDASFEFRQTDAAIFDVDRMALSLLGGRLAADPFTYNASDDELEMQLRVESIQLPFMAELAGFESLKVEGSLSGVVPVSMKAGTIRIAGGQLDNEPPGGVIRFDGAAAEAAAGAANLGIASQALRNFEFDSLSSAVEYDESGDLLLGMRITGVNPEMDPNQPVILNLNVENNIPELLRSLQAIRSIEEVLEQRTGQ